MTKLASCGTRFQASISGTYTTIAQLTNLNGAGSTTTMLDGRVLEVCTPSKIPDAIENEDVTFEVLYDPDDSGHQYLITAQQDRSLEAFKILWPDDNACTFSGYVSGFSPGAAVGDFVKATFTVSISGSITFPS